LEPTEKIVHPYLLKEFRNRWFLLGREGDATRVTNYALDRIKKIKPSNEQYLDNDLFNAFQYFNHLIGVSVPEGGETRKY
jgi:predicted DNA-binding transcriptional regulator YafY